MPPPTSAESTDKTDTFHRYRPLLFAIAYRMLGTVMDAEDILQETFIRWQDTRQEVENPRAFLSAIVTRLSIDQLRSARVQRESYIGPWLPEPYLTDAQTPMLDTVLLSETLSTAFLVMMERLTPTERAVFLLRDVFDYEYAEIAEIVGKSQANCRKLLSRARRHIRANRPRFDPDPDLGARLAQQFLETVMAGDVDGLLEILAEDIVVYSDGGGKAFAAQKPIAGVEKASRFFFGLARLAPPGLEVRPARINGLPGMIFYVEARPLFVMALHISGDRIANIFTVLNPDKLGGIEPLS